MNCNPNQKIIGNLGSTNRTRNRQQRSERHGRLPFYHRQKVVCEYADFHGVAQKQSLRSRH